MKTPDAEPTRSPDKTKREYEVGYGKPPKHGQFQPGRSGNPKGRPKGVKSIKGHLLDLLNQKIMINEGGRSRSITMREAIAKRMTEAALKGDLKTIMQLLTLDALQTDEANRAAAEELTLDELAMLERFMAGSEVDLSRSESQPDLSDIAQHRTMADDGKGSDD